MSVTGSPAGEPSKVGRRPRRRDRRARGDRLDPRRALGRDRDPRGRGQRIEVDLLSSALAALVNQASGYLNAGAVPQRLGNVHPSIEPFATYAAADGPLMICAGNDRQFAALADAVGEPGLAADARFADNRSRVANRDALRELLERRLAAAGVDEWSARLGAAGVPAGPVNDLATAFELAESLGLDPVDEHAGVRTVRSPLGLSATPAVTRRPPPALDEHGGEIRAWLAAERPAPTARGDAAPGLLESPLDGGISPSRPKAVVPRARAAGARALARRRHLRAPGRAAPRGRRADLELLRGAADRERQAGLPPRARARLQGRLPALPRDARQLRAAQGGLGLPRAAGRARDREGARDPARRRRSRSTGSRSSTQRAASRCSATSRTGTG